jgi:hypothetical protein
MSGAKFFQELADLAHKIEQPRAAEAPAPEPKFLSVESFAVRCDLTERAVRALIRAGMPVVRPRPRLTRIPVAEAEAWIRARANPANDTAASAARRRAKLDTRKGELH